MSTRVETTKFSKRGPIQVVFTSHVTVGWQWELWKHINDNWLPPEIASWAFDDPEKRIGGQIVRSFDDFDAYMHHLTEGDGGMVEYVFAWFEERGKWAGISLNCDNWEATLHDAVFKDGVGNCLSADYTSGDHDEDSPHHLENEATLPREDYLKKWYPEEPWTGECEKCKATRLHHCRLVPGTATMYHRCSECGHEFSNGE